MAARNWLVGSRIDYHQVIVSRDDLVQELHFGWRTLGDTVFGPGKRPPFELLASQSIHTNPQVAHRYGLREVVVPGVRLFAYIADMLLSEFGMAWAECGSLSVKFVAPALAGDTLSVYATVKEVIPAERKTKLILDVSITNQHDERLVQGEAMVSVLTSSDNVIL